MIHSESSLRVLVTSAGGRVGKELIAQLRQQEIKKNLTGVTKKKFIRAATRFPDSKQGEFLKQIGADEVIAFDFAKPTTFGLALKSINVVYDSSPDPLDGGFELIEQHKAFMEALDPRKIKHVVRLSCIGTRLEYAYDTARGDYINNATKINYETSVGISNEIYTQNSKYEIQNIQNRNEVPHVMRAYAFAEKYMLERGLALTSIRGGFFMGHFLKSARKQILEKGLFQTTFSKVKKPDISTNDIGALCAKVIMDGPEQHLNEFYEVTGSVNESMEDIVRHLSTARGEKCTYEEQEVTEDIKTKVGMARWEFVSFLLEHKEISERISPDFKKVMGRYPVGYDEYLSKPGAAGENGLQDIFGS